MNNVYMVHIGPGGTVFVKELEFFRSQRGFEQPWGEAWFPIVASGLEDARVRAKLNRHG
ncbi:MAG TPA: hypothetical protein VI423_02185 [Paenisporosarcina sp.]|nr:hypothetical protein [Paenisporosarcina sp.]